MTRRPPSSEWPPEDGEHYVCVVAPQVAIIVQLALENVLGVAETGAISAVRQRDGPPLFRPLPVSWRQAT